MTDGVENTVGGKAILCWSMGAEVLSLQTTQTTC